MSDAITARELNRLFRQFLNCFDGTGFTPEAKRSIRTTILEVAADWPPELEGRCGIKLPESIREFKKMVEHARHRILLDLRTGAYSHQRNGGLANNDEAVRQIEIAVSSTIAGLKVYGDFHAAPAPTR
jgi:hypothetical protein